MPEEVGAKGEDARHDGRHEVNAKDVLDTQDELVAHDLEQSTTRDDTNKQGGHGVKVVGYTVRNDAVEELLVDERDEHTKKAHHQGCRQQRERC